ncbi:MAG: NUDIX hydrolase [Catenisphaera adipataccumulans]|jgi:ADP-ribose pyrophosphatase|uniref:NUDIX hydrolase n=1 Tax=Catenisphaera adipataccumulans TaxID=700500 RepID=UPI003D8FF75F
MAKIFSIQKKTDEHFVNLYEFDGINTKGHESHYMVATRARSKEQLKAVTHDYSAADAVVIYSIYNDQVVLVKQYRYPIDGAVYEFPAGLVEEGETLHEAAAREMKEETGLELKLLDVDPLYEKPRFTSVGMTDETNAMVYGYASGTISDAFAEPSEEIEIVLADRQEARRILEEENVALQTAYPLSRFVSDEAPFGFVQ